MKKIEIKWIDSSYTDGWASIDYWDEDPLKHCHSIGFEIKRMKDYVVIGCTVTEDPEQAVGVIAIPIKCILSERYFK